jgi:hypothetical protein
MEKKYVFMVSGQVKVEGEPNAVVKQYVVCSADADSVRIFLETVEPGIQILSIVALTMYEDIVKRIRLVLLGEDTSWPVYVDPALQETT